MTNQRLDTIMISNQCCCFLAEQNTHLKWRPLCKQPLVSTQLHSLLLLINYKRHNTGWFSKFEASKNNEQRRNFEKQYIKVGIASLSSPKVICCLPAFLMKAIIQTDDLARRMINLAISLSTEAHSMGRLPEFLAHTEEEDAHTKSNIIMQQ